MKKTIATIAMLASTQSFAMLPPPNPNAPKPVYVTACVTVYAQKDGAKYGGCDSSHNNQITGAKLTSSGCTDKQVALQFLDKSPIEACMPAGFAQL